MVTLKDARQATDSIVKSMHPQSVVVFGSVARVGNGNDLDLLIVLDDTQQGGAAGNLLLQKCLKRFYRRFSIDPFMVPASLLDRHFRMGSPFLRLISREGRVLYMRDAVQEWVKQSTEEMKTARYLLDGGYFKGACYHAQQSIEKTMKARLFQKGWELEKTHSIGRLVALGKDYKIKFKMSDEDVVFVDNIYRGRYPLETGLLPLGEPSKADAERALAIGDRLLTGGKKLVVSSKSK